MNARLNILADGSECVPYVTGDFPVYAGGSRLSVFADFEPRAHWHDDFEFHYVTGGRLMYTVNGEETQVCQGQGIFINSRQLHGVVSADVSGGEYICVLIHPSLLTSSRQIGNAYIAPLINGAACRVLDKSVPWQENVIQGIIAMHDMFEGDNPGKEMFIMATAFRVFERLTANMPPSGAGFTDRRIPVLDRINAFLRRNMARKLSLTDIALAGNVSASTCCKLFKQYMNMTPITYLNNVRLERGLALLLNNPELSVTEIAVSTGYSNQSYFTECFKRRYGVSPSECRKQNSRKIS